MIRTATDEPGAAPTCGCGAVDPRRRLCLQHRENPGRVSLTQHRKRILPGVKRENATLPDRENLLYLVLSQGENLYLAWEMCWVLKIDQIDAYIVEPRTQLQLTQLIQSIAPPAPLLSSIETSPAAAGTGSPPAPTPPLPPPTGEVLDLIVGVKGPLAPPARCNGLQLPMLLPAQVFSFGKQQFIDQIAALIRQQKPNLTNVGVQAASLFNFMLQLTDNAGESAGSRAINYTMFRYEGIYKLYAEMLDNEYILSGIFTEEMPMEAESLSP